MFYGIGNIRLVEIFRFENDIFPKCVFIENIFISPAEAWRSDTSRKTVTSQAAWIHMLGPSSKLQGASGSNTQDTVARTTPSRPPASSPMDNPQGEDFSSCMLSQEHPFE